MNATIVYRGKQGTPWFERDVPVKSERAAKLRASREWTYGCGDILVLVNQKQFERRFWSQSGQWGLYPWGR